MIKTIFKSSLLLILIVFIFVVSRNIYSQMTKFGEIQKAQNTAERLENKNEKLKQDLQRKSNAFFKEKQARDKLGYQKPGDVLFVVTSKNKQSTEKNEERKENWQKWLELFF